MAENFPSDVDIVVYAEEDIPVCKYDRINWIDLNTVEPELTKFKNKHKNDPIANGKLKEIPGGLTRPKELEEKGGADKNNESFLWDAVRFSNKVFCIINCQSHRLNKISQSVVSHLFIFFKPPMVKWISILKRLIASIKWHH